MEWQPIETAPAEKAALIYCPYESLRVGYMAVATFYRGEWMSYSYETGMLRRYNPTHWMPLPDPPVTPASGASDTSSGG